MESYTIEIIKSLCISLLGILLISLLVEIPMAGDKEPLIGVLMCLWCGARACDIAIISIKYDK